MIISRTPFRISLFGGGTDYPAFYNEHGGSVLNTSINKYCYVTCRYLPPFFDHKFRVRYTKREETQTINDIQHPSVRACLNYLNLRKGVEVLHTSDIPAMSGMGSSSSFTVGLLNTLYALKGKMPSKRELCMNAITIEQDILNENVGSQDQTVAAFGGFNRIDFSGERKIVVSPVTISPKKINFLQNHLMLFFTGFSRIASHIAKEQIEKTPSNTQELLIMKSMVDESINILNSDSEELLQIGKLLHETWKIKKSLSSKISSLIIDEIYETAKTAGAIGGKLCGAGGGGFMLLFVPPEKQSNVKEALHKLIHVPFNFEELGSQIIYRTANSNV